MISLDFRREIPHQINRTSRMIGLIGERGVGKTTIMLQKLEESWSGLYFSADTAMIKDVGLFKFAYYLYFELWIYEIYVDEVHKYANRIEEMKNIYDSLPKMKVIFSGSSSLDLYKGMLDLLRRTDFYAVNPMNYHEYLQFFHQINIPTFSFLELLENYDKIAVQYWYLHRETLFEDFLQKGQYPYIKNLENTTFITKFQMLFDKVIIEDLPVFMNMQTVSLDKLRRLLYFIANNPPSELSFANLGKKIWIEKALVDNALTLLSKIWIITLVPKFWNLSDRVRKEHKIFLGNTNLYTAYNLDPDKWILRECFMASQLKRIKNAELFSPSQWDLIVEILDKVYHFEIWGKSKQAWKYDSQIYVVKDWIIVSNEKRTIPLWLFWLLK